MDGDRYINNSTMFGVHNVDIKNYLTEKSICDLPGGNVRFVDVDLFTSLPINAQTCLVQLFAQVAEIR